MRLLIAFILAVFLSMSVGYAGKRPMIIDTDAAFDDMLAITYLLQRPDIDVKAITIAATGESHCLPAKANLHILIKTVGHDNIPISCGRSLPMKGHHRFPAAWSAFTDSLANAKIMRHKTVLPGKNDAVPLINALLQHSVTPYDIVALGPLTNLGELLQQTPALTKKIHMIYIMGGAVHVPGNLQLADQTLNQTAEWNFYIDPHAVNSVFSSGANITLVPLDVTNSIQLDSNFFQLLAQSRTVPAASLISQLHEASMKYKTNIKTDPDWFVWDTVAAVIASDQSIVSSKIEKLRVILDPDHESGSIVVDKRHGNPIHVCYQLNYPRFMRDLTYFLTHQN